MMIDSNILVFSLSNTSPKYKRAKDFLKSSSNIFIAHQNIFETVRILTHPKLPNPFSHTRAIKALELIVQRMSVIAPRSDTHLTAFELIKKYDIKGNQIFDAYLVATALSNGIYEIATDNVKHLGKYKEIKVINPFMID